jgi:Guanylate-binding protein, N-terminal domain
MTLLQQRKKSRKDIGLHEWLYEREEWQGMRQVFATSSQSRAQTKNIWITKQPFILTMGKLRSKVAVFLIDTQGLFDTDSNSTVDSQLFYLSSLLSSTLVIRSFSSTNCPSAIFPLLFLTRWSIRCDDWTAVSQNR